MLKHWFRGQCAYRRQLLFEQLEERIVLDAAGGADAQNATDSNDADSDTGQTEGAQQSSDTSDATDGATASNQADAGPLAEVFEQDLSVVLISSELDNVEALQAASAEDAYVVVYDGASADVSDVVEALHTLVEATGQEIGQLAILSHGQEGALVLGDTNVETLNSIQDDGSAWQGLASILSDDARIDLYGCYIGQADGVNFVQAIAQLTGATVWASDDKTGGTDGDWDLEVQTGDSDRGFLIDGSELDDLGVSLDIISPVANDQTVTPNVWENAETTITVTGHDGKDPDKGDVTFAIVSDPSHGTLVLGDLHDLGNGDYSQDYQYTPDTGYTGADSFEFTITTPYEGPWQQFDSALGVVETSSGMMVVQLGDIDNDGDLDAIMANARRSFSIYTNDGSGNFTYVQSIGSMTGELRFAELGDFNNDGYLDFIGGGHGAVTQLFLNDGSGTFTAAGVLDGVQVYSRGAKAGDIDGDGDLDILVLNGTDLTRIYKNDGTGSFTYEGEFGLYYDRTTCIDMGDIDNDGDLDVVIGQEGRDECPNTVWTNDGTGVFTHSGYIKTSYKQYDTHSIKLGDLDGDGDLDVVTGNWFTGNRMYKNDGTGSFYACGAITGDSDDTPSIELADVDNDGDLDVIAGNYEDVNKVYLNNGSGGFSSAKTIDSRTDGTRCVVLGDLDNDGDLDVLSVGGNSDARVTFNNGRDYGAPPFVVVIQTDPGTYSSNSIQLGDIDNDGDADLISGNDGVNTVYTNDGDGVYTAAGEIGTDSDTTYSIQFGDVDKDGDLDVIVGNDGVNRVYLNDGGVFLQSDSGDIGTDSDTTYSIQLGDVDNDGDLDVIAGNDGVNRVYLNDGGVFLQSDSDDIGTDSDTTYSIQFGDVDNDGDLDVVAGNDGVNRIYLNDGTGVFTAAGVIGTGSDKTYSIQLADVDNDGDLDVIAGNDGVNRVYLNDGGGVFTDAGDIGTESDTTYSIQLVDEDHDGDLDVITGNQNEVNRLYVNDGAGNFTYSCDITSDDSDTRSIQAYDVNSDGIAEFVVGGHGASHTVYARDAIESSAVATVTMTIDPINHEPIYTGLTTVTANEDVPLEITFSGEDGDGWATQDLTYWLKGGENLTNGHLYETESDALNRTNPIDLSGLDVEVSWGTSVWYMSDPDVNTGASFTLYVTDDGGTEGGGDDTSQDYTVNVTVQPVNDEPSYTGPTVETTDEDVPVEISFAGNDGDTDAIQDLTYHLCGGSDLTNGDLYMTETDALARVNAIDLSSGDVTATWGASVWYVSDRDDNTNTSFRLYVTDSGGTANGGDDTSPGYTVNVTVNPVNDAPELAIPGPQQTQEDSALDITGLSVADVDVNETVAPNNTVEVSLTVHNGSITLDDPSLVNFTLGDGVDDATMTFSGTLAQVNAAVDTIEYTPNRGYSGEDELAVVVDDLGHTGGGSLSAQDTVLITITNIPDKRVDGLPGTYTDSWAFNGEAYGDFFSTTVGPAPEIGELLTFLGAEGLLPGSLVSGAGAATESVDFASMLSAAIFADDLMERNEAWGSLSSFISDHQHRESDADWLALTDFLQRLKEWRVGATPDEILLAFNANEIKLAEWFNELMGLADALGAPGARAMETDELSWQSLSAKSRVFDMAEARAADLFLQDLGDYGVPGFNKACIKPSFPVCSLFDLTGVSFLQQLTG